MDIKFYIEKVKDFVPGQMTLAEQTLVLSTLEFVLNFVKGKEEEVQMLKDEINRLKGEDGKPNISAKNQKEKGEKEKEKEEEKAAGNHSSEKERKEKKKRKKRIAKFDSSLRIDETVVIDIENKDKLPKDIEFKNYAISHYQDLIIVAKNIEVKRAIYYSPSNNRTYTASLPDEYKIGSDYTQRLKAHAIMLKFEFGMSIPKIWNFLGMHGINISQGTVSNILLENAAILEEESMAVHRNGMEAAPYVQTDSTGARVNGENYNSHIFCNDYFTSYFTTSHKDRLTILDLVRCREARVCVLNESTFITYTYLKVPAKIQEKLSLISFAGQMDEKGFLNRVSAVLNPEDFEKHKNKILEGAYLAAYLADKPVNILVCDDAPQYKLLALQIALCWIHVGRHLKKLNPTLTHHQELLSDFLNPFWQYYHLLKEYQKVPHPTLEKWLSTSFDELFSKKTGYEELDDRIAKIMSKKKELLVVLQNPYVPLHNNESELAARKEVRHRDISFQTRNIRGTLAKDVFFTIIQTCKKLGVNAYAYMLDKLTNGQQMMPLDKLILLRAQS
jgi:hypothetical protein